MSWARVLKTSGGEDVVVMVDTDDDEPDRVVIVYFVRYCNATHRMKIRFGEEVTDEQVIARIEKMDAKAADVVYEKITKAMDELMGGGA